MLTYLLIYFNTFGLGASQLATYSPNSSDYENLYYRTTLMGANTQQYIVNFNNTYKTIPQTIFYFKDATAKKMCDGFNITIISTNLTLAKIEVSVLPITCQFSSFTINIGYVATTLTSFRFLYPNPLWLADGV